MDCLDAQALNHNSELLIKCDNEYEGKKNNCYHIWKGQIKKKFCVRRNVKKYNGKCTC